MIEEIITGGQTGVDQAALRVAIEIGLPISGWCPKGGLDEKNVNILEEFPFFRETSSSNPDERTKLNIDDSDGTLVIVPTFPLKKEISDGTVLTIKYAEEKNKPFLILSLRSSDNKNKLIADWVEKNGIRKLNIAGPRESTVPGIHKESCFLFREIFLELFLKNTSSVKFK